MEKLNENFIKITFLKTKIKQYRKIKLLFFDKVYKKIHDNLNYLAFICNKYIFTLVIFGSKNFEILPRKNSK